MLYVSVQAHIINLIRELQEKLKLTYLFISHNLSVIQHLSDRIAVMYLGKLVEVGGANEIFERPFHPYTQALLEAIPVPDPDIRKGEVVLEGGVPSPESPPSGCGFHTRCPHVSPVCREKEPKSIDVGGGHLVACHLVARV